MEVIRVDDCDFQAFTAIMGAIAEALGQPKLSRLGLRLFFDVLKPYPFKEVSDALYATLRQSPFMPKPSDVVRYIEGTAEDRAREAWHAVLETMRKYGAYASVKFDDPAIHFAIERMGGWQKLCLIPEEELPFRERDFIAHYKRGERAGWEIVPKYFVGIIEQQNTQNGWMNMIPEIVEISARNRILALNAYKLAILGCNNGE
jgi:hypothetical protein